MKWWIVEDALRGESGHWVEYLKTFKDGLQECGDEVIFFCDREAERNIVDIFDAEPCLPRSIWRRVSQPVAKWKRFWWIVEHALATRKIVNRLVKKKEHPDVIFVPTVLVHHLLGWWWLIEFGAIKNSKIKVLLFFPFTPVLLDPESGKGKIGDDLTAKLFKWLIQKLKPAVEDGRLILGVETFPMKQALEEAIGVPFEYFPHPVQFNTESKVRQQDGCLVFGAYGAARFEKGSDVLLSAVADYLRQNPETNVRFVIQWLGEFADASGELVFRDSYLLDHPKVEFVENYFEGNGYTKQLLKTDVMILPYRKNYALRVSRVVIEAMLHSMPVLVSDRTTLADQAVEFGAALPVVQDDPESLRESIEIAVSRIDQLQVQANQKVSEVRKHFSVKHFRTLLSKYIL